METKKEAILQGGKIDLSETLKNLQENKKLQEEVYEALYSWFILTKKPVLTKNTEAFFSQFRKDYGEKDRMSKYYALFDALNSSVEDSDEKVSKEVDHGMNQTRKSISFLEQAGQEPVQWLVNAEAEKNSEMMGKISDLEKGDVVVYQEGLERKPFIVSNHNRNTKIIFLENNEGEEKRILYRVPTVLENSIKQVVDIQTKKNKGKSNERAAGYEDFLKQNKTELAGAAWDEEQRARKARKNKAA